LKPESVLGLLENVHLVGNLNTKIIFFNTTWQVKESIWIWKEPACMNRDGGAYSLPTAYDRLLVTCSTSRDHKPDEAGRWRAKCRN